MDLKESSIGDLIDCEASTDLPSFLDTLDRIITRKIGIPIAESVVADFIDSELISEIESYTSPSTSFYFGSSLKELKCVIDEGTRKHEMLLSYNRCKKISMLSINIPWSVQDHVYKSLDEAVTVFKKHISSLVNYFKTLDQIDNSNFPVRAPLKPTYRDNYRKVDIGNNIWLHLEVHTDGIVRPISFVAQIDCSSLEHLLLNWDDDMDIVWNIETIRDFVDNHLRKISTNGSRHTVQREQNGECRICFNLELEGDIRVPEPLCQNCNMYFHNSCLYQWFITCDPSRQTHIGVAIGVCPNCRKQICCYE